jgi:excisionase family DNA binding protein
MQKQTYSVPEAAKILGLNRNSGYDAVKRGEIPVIKIGKRLLVPKVAIERLLQGGAA